MLSDALKQVHDVAEFARVAQKSMKWFNMMGIEYQVSTRTYVVFATHFCAL